MVMGRKEVAVDFITRLKDKGFKDLDKATKKSQSTLKKFGKGLGATFSIVALGAFVKGSIKKFSELEKSTKQLQSELNNLGIAFATALASDFVRKLALSSGVTQTELIPALQKLVQTTYTLTDAQKLLTLSTEISQQKGLELEQVSNALSRAFLGDYNALVKLRIGYEKAELKGRDFADVLKQIEGDFSSKQADTFADKIQKLKAAFEQTQEAIGKGFVEGLEESGVSIEEFQKTMIDLGFKVGKVISRIVTGIDKLAAKFTELKEIPILGSILKSVEQFFTAFQGDLGSVDKDFFRKELQLAADKVKLLKEEEALRKKRLQDLAKLQADEKRKAAEKKRTAEIERLKNAISFKFDTDAINLQAALRRNLSQEDRDRALQLSALKISDYQTDEEAIKTLIAATQGRYDDAMNLEKVLQLLKTAGYATDKTAIAALAALDPKIKFTDNLEDIRKALKELIEGKYTINIGATITMPAIPGITNGGTVTARPDPARVRKYDEDTSRDIPIEPGKPPIIKDPFIDLPGEIGGEPAMGSKDIFAPDTAFFRYFEELGSSRLRNLFSPGAVPSNFDISSIRKFEETGFTDRGMATPSFFNPAGFRARDEGVVVNVNVQGSLLAQNDLVAAVTDAVYQTQRTGNALLIDQ
jgi:hypothetical protein